MASVIEIEATVTERGQTTVPAAIRNVLHLGKRDSIVFRGMADGTVTIAKKGADSDEDPLLGRFLTFLAKDMEDPPGGHPPRLRRSRAADRRSRPGNRCESRRRLAG